MATHCEHTVEPMPPELASVEPTNPVHQEMLTKQARFEAALGPSRTLWHALEPGVPPRDLPPTLDRALEQAQIRTASGKGLRLAPEQRQAPHYELRVLGSGQLAYRPGVWHDWFNALCWLTWPNAKAALNFRHCLHYTTCLIRHHPLNWKDVLGAKVPRDRWMQMLANLDEGGCVVERSWLHTHAAPDAARVMRWQQPPSAAALDTHLSWFGHAVLELLRNACAPTPGSASGSTAGSASGSTAGSTSAPAPSIIPRMFVLEVETLEDHALASRILTCAPELEPELEVAREGLEQLGWTASPTILAHLRYADADPFLGPSFSLYCPWGAD